MDSEHNPFQKLYENVVIRKDETKSCHQLLPKSWVHTTTNHKFGKHLNQMMPDEFPGN